MPVYRLVEVHADGRVETEEFEAPEDHEAWSRAREVAEGELVELWRGEVLVQSTRR